MLAPPLKIENILFTSSQFASPLLDGRPVVFEAKAVYDSPYLQGGFGAEAATILEGTEVLNLNYAEQTSELHRDTQKRTSYEELILIRNRH